MSDKDLSKPVAWMYEWAGCVTCEGPQDWRVEITDEAPPSWAVIEGQCRNLKALFPREYVNLLLSQIASLKSERETMHSVEYVQSLLGRIAELELDRDVWQALALRDAWREETHHNGMMQLSNELAKANARIAELEREKSYATFQPVAARDVLKERLRQVTEEGWTPQHDDQHNSGELAGAAACYAQHANARGWIYKEAHPGDYQEEDVPNNWPWAPEWWKPVSPRRDLVRAGALILAEIDRLDRAGGSTVQED